MKSRHFVDTVPVHVRGGKGGNGTCSFRREKFVPRGGPDGGDGGHGGDVVFRGDENVDSLIALFYQSRIFAENGKGGAGQRKHGRRGSHRIVDIPLGTNIVDAESGAFVGEILEHGQELVVAAGGKGGLGNVHWKSSTHQAPREFTPGEEGEERRLRLDLRLIADAGLVGFPSAGKSSILRRISRAQPKVAAYPFTTLNPIMGTVADENHPHTLRVADIPGLVEDAHKGVGLGHHFLRHIERSPVLVFVIDMAGYDGREPWDDYRILVSELRQRDPELIERSRIVVGNKMDLPEAADNLPRFREETGVEPLAVSALDGTGLPELVQALFEVAGPRDTSPEALPDTASSLHSLRSLRDKLRERSAASRKPAAGRETVADPAAPELAESRKGYTPPRPLEGRGEHPGSEGTVTADKFEKATFLQKD